MDLIDPIFSQFGRLIGNARSKSDSDQSGAERIGYTPAFACHLIGHAAKIAVPELGNYENILRHWDDSCIR